MIICPHDQCTGCAACLNSCSHNAIKMVQGINGHLYPEVNDDVCVGCKLCVNICPNNHLPEYHKNMAAYIATAIDSDEAKTSTSAGIATVFSRFIIRQGGVVYGSSGIDCTHIHHIRVNSEHELYKIKGSKYVHSAIEDILLKVKTDLKIGLKVLFIGTPCQVSGLLSYLRKPYDNLYTIDFVCHGVPSQQILTDCIIACLPNENPSKIDLKFRIKEKGKSRYGLFAFDKDGKTLYRSLFPDNGYITGFLYGLFYRESCYQCHFTRPERVSDLTVGDYWDREHQINLVNSSEGLSMLAINTEKGSVLVNKCDGMIMKNPYDYSQLVIRNGQLSHPIKKHSRYETFKRDYMEKGALLAINGNIKNDVKRIKRNLFLIKISHIVYQIPGLNKLYRILRSL